MKKTGFRYRLLRGMYNYVVFFLLTAFLVSCTTMLFVSVLAKSLGIELTSDNIQIAAKLTFLNVIILSLLFTIIDEVRRRVTTERVTEHITSAANRIVNGDFDVRIEHVSNISADDSYNEIIDCFNTMAKELSSVETLRTDFIANVSHEMKTPLAVMQNCGTLLQSPELSDEERIEYARTVADSSRRLADMMTNILKLNRLENQRIYPNSEAYDLGEQLCECLLQYESIWERKGINIETDIEEGITVRQDSELLALVWNNLFSNAFKFTDTDGTVSLTLKRSGGYAIVSVSDTGCGMSQEVGAHIFEKFYQADTSRATQGNGLGLALVKRVIDIVGGEIGVESKVGEGSVFTVKIRREDDGPEEDR